MAARLGGRAGLPRRQPRAGRAAGRRVLHARDAPVPLGRAAHGARPELHARGRRHALPAPQRLHGAASDGLGLVRPAGRERGDQRGRPSARDHRAEHRQHRAPDAPPGLGDRLGPRDRGARAGLLPLDAMALPEVLRGRACLPEGGARQLVPERPDRARERAGDRRTLRAVRRPGRGEEPGAVVLPDHRLCRRAAGRPRVDRLARPHDRDPAQLDRPLRGRGDSLPPGGARRRHPGLHDSARHAVRRDLPGARARASAGAARLGLARSRGVRSPYGGAVGRGACNLEVRRLHGAVCPASSDRKTGADLGRRLRPDGLRNRGDHGRSRPRRARWRIR